MKVSELKKIIKPMIKDCIREVLLEEGMLSKIVQETAVGLTNAKVLKEEKQTKLFEQERKEDAQKKNRDARKKLLNSIGTQNLGGVDIFENTTPMAAESSGQSPLSGQQPHDAGIDISNLPGMKNWKRLV